MGRKLCFPRIWFFRECKRQQMRRYFYLKLSANNWPRKNDKKNLKSENKPAHSRLFPLSTHSNGKLVKLTRKNIENCLVNEKMLPKLSFSKLFDHKESTVEIKMKFSKTRKPYKHTFWLLLLFTTVKTPKNV